MDKFNTLSKQNRESFFQESAVHRGVLPIIIEKDFWVCWVLERIFADKALGVYLTFKGGTSLSKAYNLIERFSEDIDLTICKDSPFLKNSLNPMEKEISGKECQRRIKSLKSNAQSFVSEIALPTLTHSFSQSLGNKGWKLILDEHDPDRQTLLFYYPCIFGEGRWDVASWGEAWDHNSYVSAVIRLEFGARGESEPSREVTIAPYIANDYPQLFDSPKFSVCTLAPERTFWEKVTILHALHHGASMRDRMSRHYYDTYMMAQQGIVDIALENIDLLYKVVENKTILFKDNKASYSTAQKGTLRVLPMDEKLLELQRDYTAMESMFMGKYPSFEVLLDGLGELEQTLNY